MKSIPTKRITLLIAASVAALLSFSPPALAGPGALDRTFGHTGKVTTFLRSSENAYSRSVAVQSDGKIVVAGVSDLVDVVTDNGDFAVVRFNANGSLDVSFNSTGKVTTDFFGIGASSARGVAIQTDGKIVVAGRAWNPNASSYDQIAVVRYNANGSLDTAFNGTGKVATAVGSRNSYARAVAVQADGKIVVAGYATPGAHNDFALVRYNANGSLDTSFNGTGKVTTDIGGGSEDAAYGMVLQSDGKILVAGESDSGGGFDVALVRYHANGSLDTTFNGSGKAVTAIGTGNDSGVGVAVQTDGKILVAGESESGASSKFALVRYQANGALDPGFNGTGKVTTAVGSYDVGRSVAVQSDGKIVVCGSSFSSGFNEFAIVRYNTDGSLDTALNGSGKMKTRIGKAAYGESLALQSDGKMLVTGQSDALAYPGASGGKSDLAVARFLQDGSLDPGFGTPGRVTTDVSRGREDYASAAAITTSGGITVGGRRSNGVDQDFFIAGFDSAGILTGEVKVIDFGGQDDILTGLLIQPDGRIVASGYSENGTNADFELARLNQFGSLDTSFNGTGKVITAVGSGNDYAQCVTLQADGKLLLGGFASIGSTNDFALVRYNADGSLDSGFGSGGKVTTAIGGGHDQAYCMALQSDGKILLGGIVSNGSNFDFGLARYLANGSLDTTFGSGGKVTTAIGSGDDRMYSLAIQSDGKIVGAGYATSSGNADVALVRYNANGSLDTTFGIGGKVTTPVGSNDDIAFSVKIASSGKILVGGAANSGRSDFMLLRYLSNGTLDPIFGSGGKVVTRTGAGDNVAYAMAIQNDGNVVLAGRAHNGSDNDLALARFLGFAPAIRVSLESIPGTPISDGQTIDFGAVERPNGGASQNFIVRNVGDAPLTGIANANTGGFSALPVVSSTVNPGESTHFLVEFVPTDPALPTGQAIGTLYIASNDIDGLLTLGLRAFAYSSILDFDGDGMSDWGEYKLSALGFNWQVSQPALVSALYNNANAAKLFTQTQYDANRQVGRNEVTANPNAFSLYALSQVQALNVGTPLLTRGANGKFTLTMALKKSANLIDYQPFPFTDPGTAINAQGEVEFEFTAPGNAAFFRIEAK